MAVIIRSSSQVAAHDRRHDVAKVHISAAAEHGDRLRQRCTRCGYRFLSTAQMAACPRWRSRCHGRTEVIGIVSEGGQS